MNSYKPAQQESASSDSGSNISSISQSLGRLSISTTQAASTTQAVSTISQSSPCFSRQYYRHVAGIGQPQEAEEAEEAEGRLEGDWDDDFTDSSTTATYLARYDTSEATQGSCDRMDEDKLTSDIKMASIHGPPIQQVAKQASSSSACSSSNHEDQDASLQTAIANAIRKQQAPVQPIPIDRQSPIFIKVAELFAARAFNQGDTPSAINRRAKQYRKALNRLNELLENKAQLEADISAQHMRLAVLNDQKERDSFAQRQKEQSVLVSNELVWIEEARKELARIIKMRNKMGDIALTPDNQPMVIKGDPLPSISQLVYKLKLAHRNLRGGAGEYKESDRDLDGLCLVNGIVDSKFVISYTKLKDRIAGMNFQREAMTATQNEGYIQHLLRMKDNYTQREAKVEKDSE
ncbi:hypothetical protein H7Y21_01010 [Arenimonas sp.]|nr:hypothetical protein [Candidatus Parcubacteria bacterium]